MIIMTWFSLIASFLFLSSYTLAGPSDKDSSEHGVLPGERKTNCPCGWANKMGKRIIGGVEAGKNEWPMMAGIIERDSGMKKNMHICGGTIISNWHIVTAGHCVHNADGRLRSENELGIVLAAHNLTNLDYGNPDVLKTPKKLIPHPGYKWPRIFDIAIILMEKFEFSQILGPACLPTERIDFVGKNFKVIGWGDTDPKGTIPDVLMKTTITGVDPEECDLYDDHFDMKTKYQMCTFQEDFSGQCVGDSGGPILWNDPQTNRYTLVALPSFGFLGCVQIPAVCTDVTYFIQWIKDVVSNTHPGGEICSKI